RSDAVACLELAQHFLPLEIELSRVSGTTLHDASRATTGQLVEALLMRRAAERGELIPNKPEHEEAAARQAAPIQGAFVKIPEPGIYENIAVFDFRSLYPSIIISHNVDPNTIGCKEGEDAFVSPLGHRFCKNRKGLIPTVLGDVLEARFAAKRAMKTAEGKEKAQLDARQWALKIVANSFYGYLLYARSRWYSRECGESVTAWGRHFIQETMRKAEEAGFKVLYGDTDSIMLQYEDEKKVMQFQKTINAELPEKMELELEDVYPRGIFVAKKQGEKGAKKKYAMINRDGKIKIRGFELVRRDWSRVARRTQRDVLEILLREGDVKKAVALVRKVVEELRAGTAPMEDLVIHTQLRKKNYEVKSPELGAVEKARAAGIKVPDNSLVSYVITKTGKTISEKAEFAETAKDYDADYYVNNQVLPAVLKILGAFGYDEDGIKLGGTQKGLGSW
ncbi:MAG: DNA polymerase domain-containing protein, partial [Candidatus Micrarchaeota archaeon]